VVPASVEEVLTNLVFHLGVVPCHVAWEVCHQGGEMAWVVWVRDPHHGGLGEDLVLVEAGMEHKMTR